jgi:hypothetical protein
MAEKAVGLTTRISPLVYLPQLVVQEVLQRKRATDRVDPINSMQTTEIVVGPSFNPALRNGPRATFRLLCDVLRAIGFEPTMSRTETITSRNGVSGGTRMRLRRRTWTF